MKSCADFVILIYIFFYVNCVIIFLDIISYYNANKLDIKNI